MSDAGFDLHILILSEDSGGGGRPLRALTRSMLRLVDPSYREPRVDFEPEGEEAQRATHGNLYLANDAGAQVVEVTPRLKILEDLNAVKWGARALLGAW